MKVLDHEPSSWYLLRDSSGLLLDCNCNHSFFGYSFLIRLDSDEELAFHRHGRAFLSHLADGIQNTAPVLADTRSPYKGRNLTRELGDAVSAAVREWQAVSGKPAT